MCAIVFSREAVSRGLERSQGASNMSALHQRLGLLCAVLAVSLGSNAAAARQSTPEKTIHLLQKATRSSASVRHGDSTTPVCGTAGCTFPQKYFGGHVIPNVKIYQVNWTGSTNATIASQLSGFYQTLTNSDWMDAKNEFSTVGATVSGQNPSAHPATNQIIGRGTFAGAYTIKPSKANAGAPCAGDAAKTCITDTNIASELSAQIDAHALPDPDVNTIYMTYFPLGTSINSGPQSDSCAQFCAYHSTFARAGKSVYYGVVPDFGPGSGCEAGCGSGQVFQNICSASSHEVAEAVVDAEVGLVTSQNYDYPAAWGNDSSGEIGDMCNQDADTVTSFDGNTAYTVQQTYSNVLNTCVTKLFGNASAPYTTQEFRIFANPNNATLAPTGTVDIPLKIETTNGAAQTSLTLRVKDLPANVTGTFDSATPSSDATPTLTLTSSGATAAKDVVVVVEAAGATTHSMSILLQIGSSLFSVSVAPNLQTVAAGSSVDYTVTTVDSSGAGDSISLAIAGLPTGVTGSFNPVNVVAGGTSTLTLTAGAAAVTAPSTSFTVTGTSTAGSASGNGAVAVNGTATGGGSNSFSISIAPLVSNLKATGTTTYQIKTASTGGTAESIALSTGGELPPTIVAAFNPATVTAGQGSVLTLTATGAAVGDTPFTVTGHAASADQFASADVVVSANDFTVAIDPASRSVGLGGTTTYNVATTVTAGVAENITFFLDGLPASVSDANLPDTTGGSPTTLTLRIDPAGVATPATTFTITAVADSGVTKTATASLTITGDVAATNDFSLAVAPPSASVAAPGTSTFTVTTAATAGTAESIDLTIDGLPSGVTAVFNPATVTAGAPSTLTLTVDGTATASADNVLTLTGSATSATHTATVSLTITAEVVGANDFTLAVNPTSGSVAAGSTRTFTVTTVIKAGTAEVIGFTASGLPAGVTADFSPASVTAGVASTMTVTATSGAAASTGNVLTITGTAASSTHNAKATLAVTRSAPANDFSLALSPGTGSLAAGGTASFTISSTSTAGFAERISLTAGALPAGVTATFSPAAVTAGGNSTLTLTATSSVATAASVTLTATGTAASATHTASATFGITGGTAVAPPSASVSTPASGQTISGTVSIGASATAGAGTTLSQLDVFVDNVKIGGSTSSPASVSWDTMAVANGAHSLTARATDADGGKATSAAVAVTVNNLAATKLLVSITAPASGVTLSGTVAVTATVTGGTATSVSLLLDGAVIGTGTSAPYTLQWDSTSVTNGAHDLTAHVRDADGHSADSEAVTVLVANPVTSPGKAGGCSSSGGGFEVSALLGLVGSLRGLARRRRDVHFKSTKARS